MSKGAKAAYRTRRAPARRRGGNPPFEATNEQRKMVMMLAAAGHTQKTIATRLVISVDTLQRHLKSEFDEGRDFANSSVGETLLKMALRGDDVRAIDSWFDRRGGPEWRKVTGHEQSGPGGGPIRLSAEPRRDLSHLSEEEIEAFEKLTAKLENQSDAAAHQ
jgi:DNA-binding CsgD family transcriptional regulator